MGRPDLQAPFQTTPFWQKRKLKAVHHHRSVSEAKKVCTRSPRQELTSQHRKRKCGRTCFRQIGQGIWKKLVSHDIQTGSVNATYPIIDTFFPALSPYHADHTQALLMAIPGATGRVSDLSLGTWSRIV